MGRWRECSPKVRDLLLMQNGHEIAISVHPADEHVFAKESLYNEAESLIELYRSLIVGPYKQFNARQAFVLCRVERRFEKGFSNTLTTVGTQDANSEHAAVSKGRPRLRQNVAPTPFVPM